MCASAQKLRKLVSFKNITRRTGKFPIVSHFTRITRSACDTDSATTVFPAELPPPYTAIASPDASGVPAVNCRVCQSLIGLDGKLHQHVVKCTVCNEATVSGDFL